MAGEAKVVLVGAGRMGSALLRGWLERGVARPEDITVVEPDPAARQAVAVLGVPAVADGGDALAGPPPALVLLAVKPQVMDEVASAYRRLAGEGSAFLSIAAGRTTASFRNLLGENAPVIRAMPNTPAQVGRGITVLFATARVDNAARALSERLMGAVGEVVWVGDEGLMDAVTALSGSGPAYVFYLIECLTVAGREAGLAEDLAQRLARATVAGAAELARLSPEMPSSLREQVTSPGGTTAAALEILMAEDGLEPLMVRAVAAAAERSRELAG